MIRTHWAVVIAVLVLGLWPACAVAQEIDDAEIEMEMDVGEDVGADMGEDVNQAMEAMLAEAMAAMKKAVDASPDAIKNKVYAGQKLTKPELRQVAVILAEQSDDIDVAEIPDPLEGEEAEQFEMFLAMFVEAESGKSDDDDDDDDDDQPKVGSDPTTTSVEEARAIWVDFIHFTRIVHPELASGYGQALIKLNLPPAQLLAVIEGAPYQRQYYEETMQRAQRIKDAELAELAKVAQQVEQMVEDARMAVARDATRIRDDIEALAGTLRQRRNATARLREAGEYAAPELLKVLTRRDKPELIPHVLAVMVDIGRGVVQPLSEALGQVEPPVQQQLSRALARIGYPLALPALRQLATAPGTDEDTRQVAERAFSAIAGRAGLTDTFSAAQLFGLLAEDYYAGRSSLVLDPNAQTNLMWQYDPQKGLTYRQVPTVIFGDVLAMRAAARALALEPDMTSALSLWLAANFRRENNVPAGATETGYGPGMSSPQFYATLAGPRHLQAVLGRAVSDADGELALDAIRALADTAGANSLLPGDSAQPLVEALSYPDRRVRFEAAESIAAARPTGTFADSHLVVGLLADAVRQSARKVAIVLGPDLNLLTDLANQIKEQGYDVLISASLSSATEQVARSPGIDLIVMRGKQDQIETAYGWIGEHFKLQATPVLVMPDEDAAIAVRRRFEDVEYVYVSPQEMTDEQLTAALAEVTRAAGSDQISQEQALDYALRAIAQLRDLAISPIEGLSVGQALPALVEALNDSRQDVILGAGDILALVDDAVAQQAIADAALDTERDEALRISMLDDLAVSARRFGAQLDVRQDEALRALVLGSSGDLADAAAAAHGALNAPTAKAVELITGAAP